MKILAALTLFALFYGCGFNHKTDSWDDHREPFFNSEGK